MWDPINSHLGGPQAGIPYCSQRHFLRKGKRGQGWRQTWSHTRFGTTCKAFLAPLRHTPIHCILMSVPSSFFITYADFLDAVHLTLLPSSNTNHQHGVSYLFSVPIHKNCVCARACVLACVCARTRACVFAPRFRLWVCSVMCVVVCVCVCVECNGCMYQHVMDECIVLTGVMVGVVWSVWC